MKKGQSENKMYGNIQSSVEILEDKIKKIFSRSRKGKDELENMRGKKQ